MNLIYACLSPSAKVSATLKSTLQKQRPLVIRAPTEKNKRVHGVAGARQHRLAPPPSKLVSGLEPARRSCVPVRAFLRCRVSRCTAASVVARICVATSRLRRPATRDIGRRRNLLTTCESNTTYAAPKPAMNYIYLLTYVRGFGERADRASASALTEDLTAIYNEQLLLTNPARRASARQTCRWTLIVIGLNLRPSSADSASHRKWLIFSYLTCI